MFVDYQNNWFFSDINDDVDDGDFKDEDASMDDDSDYEEDKQRRSKKVKTSRQKVAIKPRTNVTGNTWFKDI